MWAPSQISSSAHLWRPPLLSENVLPRSTEPIAHLKHPRLFAYLFPNGATVPSIIPDPERDSEAKYDALMALSREIAKKADVQPIYLDVLAWNQPHT